ncbi:hypothetical protein NHX12_024443 [Muraenolepis orangiensis]|uniref:Cerebellar degeneration-related protein 2 n=1 Tax=Muraenolepis orangiensis TaxID=630683 RepID=A0A9Q0INQ3_9TELE|nr:hypothetical protein NHX12_024443 [Muraenolepis orangiensis]
MLADMIVEEEFEIKEEEPWYDKRDLEHDLHLAAELGKTLLDRNKELELGLQQMYSTNREQVQEIEYLTKQVEVLRQVNEQHAKVYEQLDASSRELEHTNHRLGVDNRSAQQKIQRLTETAEGLQSQVEELQCELEDVKSSRSSRPQRTPSPGDTRNTHNVPCLKELQSTLGYHDDPSDDLAAEPELEWHEEEQASLRRSLCALQTQLANERAGREEAEREADVLANENAVLERRLDWMEGCRDRLAEVECEAAELRLLWRTERSARSAGRGFGPAHAAPPTALFLHHHHQDEDDHDEEEEDIQGLPAGAPAHHAGLGRSEAVKYRGVSLLNEVDAQYSALQVKYEALLRRCSPSPQSPDGEGQSHKAIQTASAAAGTDDFHPPEYKALFQEIFNCIQRTKEDLSSEAKENPPTLLLIDRLEMNCVNKK